jgi:D-3-phosphoglycerate dehydrogenase / 2-oxoglutarate reductase
MRTKAKVVVTDYVWDSLDVEHRTLDDLANLVPLRSAKAD